MMFMIEFFKTLCTTAACLSLALLFVPERKGIRNATFTVFSLVLLLLLVPRDGSFSISSLLHPDENAILPENGIYEETVKTAIADGIKQDLIRRFSLNADDVTLTSDLTVTDAGLSGSFVRLSLGKNNFFADVTAILRYLQNTYPVDCEVQFLGA